MSGEQERLRAEADRLPIVTRESAEAMRTALNDQLRATKLLLLTAGSRAVRISPPLVLDSEDAATGLEIIASALDALPA